MSTEDQSGVGGLSDGQNEQSRIVLSQETGEQPSLSSGLSDVPWLNLRQPGSLYSIPLSCCLPDSLCVFMCVFITAVPITKLFACVGGGTMQDMCYERLRAEACVD